MDEFYEYWELIPDFDKYESVGKEIVKYKRNLQDPEISARDLPQEVIEFFQDHLVQRPYPTWEILYHIIDIRIPEKNRLLEELVLNALTTLLDNIVEHPEQQDKIDKFYCLLSNLYVSEWCMSRIRDIIVPRLYDLKENLGVLDEVLLLALLSRSVHTLLTQYMNFERQRNMEKCQMKSLFLRTCHKKVHWIEILLDDKNDDEISKLNHQVYHHLKFFRLLLNMGGLSVDDSSWWSDLDAINANVFAPKSALELCHNELVRQRNIFQFLRLHKHEGFVDKLVIKNHLLNHLLSLQIEMTVENYEAVNKLLRTNNELNQHQFAIYGESVHEKRSEVELFNEYMIVKLYLNLVQSNDTSQKVIDAHLSHIQSLLKSVNDGKILFQLMQNIFTLVFLRFEHIRKTKRRRKNSERLSRSNSNQNNSHTTDVSDGTADTLQNGFVCMKTSLKAIMHSMRRFLMELNQLEVYKTCDDEVKQKFAKMLNNVDNTLWRLRIVDSEGAKKTKSTQSVKEWLRLHGSNDAKCTNVLLEATSDDEKQEPKKKVYRKKLKKRPKIAVHTDENDEGSDDPIEYQLVTEASMTEQSENRTKSRSIDSQRRVKSVISKMLMSPESLVTMCLLKSDTDNVQKLIQEFHLEDSVVASEVDFINSFKDTKEKLHEIVMNYKRITECQSLSMTNSFEIDEIRNIAEGGFEKAKFLNMLDKFTAKNMLKILTDEAKLLEKASIKHPNLKFYQGNFLNVLPLIDFMISLPCPFELNLNIYKFIIKQWNLSDVDEADHFGYRKLLRNLMDVQTIFKNNNIDKTICDLMNDEIFTLEPTQLKKQLNNRFNVIEMIEIDVSRLHNEPVLIDILQKFDLFECEANYLAKIVCYLKNVRQMMKFQTNESFSIDNLMMMNLDEAIGNIVFNQQYSPEQVENFAYNVNVNLVHSMAVSGAGEFLCPSGSNDEKLLSLFHLSEIGATSVNPELNETDVSKVHSINNMDILFYIKKESFMVAYLVKEIQKVDYKTLKYDDVNYLERVMELKSVEQLKDLYDGNLMKTVLNYDHIEFKRILKKIQGTEDLNQKLQLLSSINERQWNRQRRQLNELRDSYIEMLITNHPDGSQEKFVKLEEIFSVRKFCQLLLKCIGDIKNDGDAERLLRWCLNPKNVVQLEKEQVAELQNWMKKLKIYRKIVKILRNDGSAETEVTWAKIKNLADEQPAVLVNYLLNISTNLVLCLDFLQIHPLLQRNDEITKMWVETLNNATLNEHHHLLFKIIDTFPSQNVISFFNFALGFVNNLPSMVRVIHFLTNNADDVSQLNQIRYQKFMISTKIFECLEGNELWSLASRPLIIIEQLLMNSKIEVLRSIIKAVRTSLTAQQHCSACASTSSNMYQVGENLVYDFDAHHDELLITNDCLDLLLKLYAAKALDFQIIEVHSVPASTEVSSLDSSYGIFQMPKDIPTKRQWIPDNETSHCMCCKRQKFSLLTRRHHCRRCGRVICFSCSENRAQIGGIYVDLVVRVCIECYQQIDSEKKRSEGGSASKGRLTSEKVEWNLCGDISSDQMVRDEFNFEYSPNVGLCLAIIDLHSINDELPKFLLFHCHRLRLLLRPIRGKINPEVDLILVAKMLKCLAFSAKIRGADGEPNAIIDHADVVLKVAENGCESIAPQIPMDPINSITIRSIINDLIKAENWGMALELSVKWDRSGTAGVFSAWGVSAIKSGQYQFARGKIALAIQNVSGSSPQANEKFLKMLSKSGPIVNLFHYKRPPRSPQLLHEVLESLETTASKQKCIELPQSPLNSRFLKKESSKNVLNVMDNLRKIVEGDYGPSLKKPSDKFEWQSSLIIDSPYYDESLYYLMNYGGNVEFISFLIRNNLVPIALRYILVQQVAHDLFIQLVFIPIVKTGRLEDFIDLIKKMDENLVMWKDYIMSACKYLERRRAFNCLYQLQMLTGDLIRAAMTCIKFYLDGSGNYTELNGKSHYLVDAKSHLQTELEKAELKKVEKHESGKRDGITLKWDLKTINAHINIISLQLEVAKYLAHCEGERLETIGIMPKIFLDKPGMKTMFGKVHEKNQVAILLLVCGHSIETGFGISYRVIQECSLKSSKIYTTCTKYLAKNLPRLMEVEKLVESIKANAANEGNVVDLETLTMCDELVAMAVEIAYNQHQTEAKSQIDQLIRLILNKGMKVQCYINSNQLKTAYMLSASANNFDDIRRIMKHAEITRQENVRRLCEKKLYQRSSDDQSEGSKSDINQL